MPLRKVAAFHDWVDREHPSLVCQRVARHFLVEIGDQPWRWPSVPVRELSDQPVSELRSAELSVDHDHAVVVWYRHFYATGDVDIIAVTSH